MSVRKESKFVSVIAYIHNDREEIKSFFNKILPEIESRFEKYEIICVDDCSTDGSEQELRDYFSAIKSSQMVQIVQMSYFQGLESSMNAGRDLSIGDFVYEFDDICADYEQSLVWEIYEKLLEGYDVVSASGDDRTKFTSKLFYAIYNSTSHAKQKIGQETFRLLSRRAINRVKSMGKYIPYRKAVYNNCGLKTAVVTYKSTDHSRRKLAKGKKGERMDLAMDSFIYFTDAMEKLSVVLSGVFLMITLIMGVYLVISVFSPDKPVEGWLSTMGFLALGFFGLFCLLTLILKYLSALLNLVFKQQRYLVESVEKIHDN